MGRILAIDFGEKRIGLALSDETKTIATPLPAINVQKRSSVLDELKQILQDRNIEKILIGLPLNLLGKDTKQTGIVREFAGRVKALGSREVLLVDERFTTQTALQELKEEGLNMKKSRELVDSLVAQRILENHLRTNKQKKD